jgi:phosphatidylglycerol---prolipoprotein diacylglyceryl transferase
MTIYPLIIKLGFIEITGYGVMMMVGFLTGGWLIQLELQRRGLNEEYAADITLAAAIGGILGAKLWYAVLTHDLGTLLSRSGLVWYGGFLGGTAAVLLNGWRRRVPMRWTMQLVAPSLAAAYALGRVGCFMVNDDYGRPTSVPWAMKFPQGSPASTAQNLAIQFGIPVPPGVDPSTVMAVHPTQLYEVAAMLVAFALLWTWRTRPHGTGWLFGAYLAMAGVERFLVEILRAKDDRFLGPFTIAQVTSVGLVLVGITLLIKFDPGPELSPGPYLLPPPETPGKKPRAVNSGRAGP